MATISFYGNKETLSADFWECLRSVFEVPTYVVNQLVPQFRATGSAEFYVSDDSVDYDAITISAKQFGLSFVIEDEEGDSFEIAFKPAI